MMRSVLLFGDSNTYGEVPASPAGTRFAYDVRWPGIVREKLGDGWHVIEEGLGGRTTVNDDPVEGSDKNGRTYLKPCCMSHRPLDVIVIMLGTNDLKARFNKSAAEIAVGMGALVQDIKSLSVGTDGGEPEILLVSPPPVQEDLKEWSALFDGAPRKSKELAVEYEKIAVRMNVNFFDAGSIIQSSHDDGFHLDENAHKKLGKAISEQILKISTWST